MSENPTPEQQQALSKALEEFSLLLAYDFKWLKRFAKELKLQKTTIQVCRRVEPEQNVPSKDELVQLRAVWPDGKRRTIPIFWAPVQGQILSYHRSENSQFVRYRPQIPFLTERANCLWRNFQDVDAVLKAIENELFEQASYYRSGPDKNMLAIVNAINDAIEMMDYALSLDDRPLELTYLDLFAIFYDIAPLNALDKIRSDERLTLKYQAVLKQRQTKKRELAEQLLRDEIDDGEQVLSLDNLSDTNVDDDQLTPSLDFEHLTYDDALLKKLGVQNVSSRYTVLQTETPENILATTDKNSVHGKTSLPTLEQAITDFSVFFTFEAAWLKRFIDRFQLEDVVVTPAQNIRHAPTPDQTPVSQFDWGDDLLMLSAVWPDGFHRTITLVWAPYLGNVVSHFSPGTNPYVEFSPHELSLRRWLEDRWGTNENPIGEVQFFLFSRASFLSLAHDDQFDPFFIKLIPIANELHDYKLTLDFSPAFSRYWDLLNAAEKHPVEDVKKALLTDKMFEL